MDNDSKSKNPTPAYLKRCLDALAMLTNVIAGANELAQAVIFNDDKPSLQRLINIHRQFRQ